MSGKDKLGLGQPHPLGVTVDLHVSFVQMRPGVHLASIAQLDLGPHLSFGQVPYAVSGRHNHMGHPHNHPKRHEATYEQQNQGATSL